LSPQENEEAFTVLPQKLDEENIRLLEPFQYPEDDRGLILEELNRLLKVADALGLIEKPDEISSEIKHCSKDPPLYMKASEVALYSPTQLLHSFVIIIRRILMKLSAISTDTMLPPEILDHFPHTSVPEHASRLVAEGKTQAPKNGIVFDSSHTKLLFDALLILEQRVKPAQPERCRPG
jgi:hypothetical protein